MTTTIEQRETIAYVVRKTFPGTDRAHRDVATFEVEPEFLEGRASFTMSYSLALEKAYEVRAEDGAYAVIDRIKADGSRSMG